MLLRHETTTNTLFFSKHSGQWHLWSIRPATRLWCCPRTQPNLDDWLVELYVLAISKVISGWAPTCNSAYSWTIHSAAHQAMIWYATQSHYPDTEPTSPCRILIMPSTWLGSAPHSFLSHRFDSTMIRTQDGQSRTKDGQSTTYIYLHICIIHIKLLIILNQSYFKLRTINLIQ